MKFDQKNLENENNVSKGNPVRDFFRYVLGSLVIVIIGVVTLNILSILIVKSIPSSLEEKIHNAIFDNFHEKKLQTKKEEKLQKILNELIELSDLGEQKFKIYIVKDENENALAHIGGTIYVHDSLLKNVESLNELSFVLAHELGHYKLRHHLSAVMPVLVLTTLSTMISTNIELVQKSFLSVAELGMLKSSRDKERDADKFAIGLIKKKYGHLNGSVGFFKRLSSKSNSSSRLTKYFSTHPMPKERFDKLQEFIEANSSATGEILPYKYE